MATKLTHEIRREIVIDDEAFTVVISPDGLRLSRKRFRSGREMSWHALWQQGSSDDSSTYGSGGRPVPSGAPAV
ncbi:MAG TPA: hypothetical protein VIJ16_00640 [Gemmatimonadaceae bacterium]